MADKNALSIKAHEFLDTVSGQSSVKLLWSKKEQLAALDLARTTNAPTREVEDWRKNDPDAFPWNETENLDVEKSKREVMQAGDMSVFLADPGERRAELQDLMTIAGDDYDAKFLYYHKALSYSPVCVVVPKNTKVDYAEVVQRASGPGAGVHTTVVIVEEGAELTFYDRWEAPDVGMPVIGRTEILLQPNARLTYLQEDSVNKKAHLYRRARVRMEKDSWLNWVAMTPGAEWHAARLELVMNGSGADANLYGLFTGTGDNRADHRTHQYHGAPNCESKLIIKTLLAGRAHSIYQGVITVPRQSQKTDAYQQCRNLMLDPNTHADAIPKLEIIADDVRCSHGATIGTLNKDQMFYLQTRGLNYREALTAVAMGFAEEIIHKAGIESVQDSWRKQVSRTIGQAGADDDA